LRRKSRSTKKELRERQNGRGARLFQSLCDAAGGAWGRLGQSATWQTDYGGTPRKKDCSGAGATGEIVSFASSWE
jgi:hypothetical protein